MKERNTAFRKGDYTVEKQSEFGWTVKLKDHRGTVQWQVDTFDGKILDVWENERCGPQRVFPKELTVFIEGKE